MCICEFCDAIKRYFTAFNGISMSTAMKTPPGGKSVKKRERLK